MEMLKGPGTLPKGYIIGEMPLEEVAGSSILRNHLARTDLDEGQKQAVVELISTVAVKFKDVSALRKSLVTTPKELGLDENKIRTLLALFIDRRAAAEYK